jgi:protein-tyrosine phosphatase
MNASSIEGIYGKQVKKTALLMLKQCMVHFIATDTHSPRNRQTSIGDIVEKLKVYCPDQAHSLLCDNPRSIIINEPIKITEPHRIRKGLYMKSFFNG